MGYIDPKLYPEWFPESPLIIWIKILLAIAIILIIPYIYVNLIEPRLTKLLKQTWSKLSRIERALVKNWRSV